MVNKHQNLTDEYEERYQRFAKMRNKWPNIKNSNRSRFLAVIAKELKVTPNTLRSKLYEGRWQSEQKNA